MSYPRALGGGPLSGDKLVRIVYLDESGTGGAGDGDFVIVAGLIVHGDHQLNQIRQGLGEIQERYVPEADRNSLVLHTCDIYGGNRYWDKHRKPQLSASRLPLLRALSDLLGSVNVQVTVGLLHKPDYPPERLEVVGDKDYLQHTVGLAYVASLIEVDQWFRQNARQENCFVVAEDNKDTRQFIKNLHRLYQDPLLPTYFPLANGAASVFPLRHVHEDVSFQDKRVAHPLILADFVSFVLKRALARDPMALQLYGPWKNRMAEARVQLPPSPD